MRTNETGRLVLNLFLFFKKALYKGKQVVGGIGGDHMIPVGRNEVLHVAGIPAVL